MITTNIPNSTSISALNAKVDVFTDSALVTCTCGDYLQDFVLHKEGDTSKFFGFGVSHKLDVSFIDLDRKLTNIKKGNMVRVALGDGTNFDYPYPNLYITELARNEKTNNITCVAYDSLNKSNFIPVSQLKIGSYPAKISDYAQAIVDALNIDGVRYIGNIDKDLFDTKFAEPLNLSGDEPVRVLLDAIAEFTQTIYYMARERIVNELTGAIREYESLVFKGLSKDGDPVLTVDKEMYFELTTLTPRTLTGLCHATELGDNLATSDDSGVVQIMRENPFYDMNPNTATLLDEAAARMSGFTIHQLECEWDGNHLLEIGDKVAFVADDGSTATTYIINDVIEYQGFINEITSWEYTQEDSTAANPTNIGDKINQTYAKVDKVNKEITLLVSDVRANADSISSLKLTSDEINASVKTVSADIETLTEEVGLKVNADAVSIVVQQTLSEGVDRVVTASKKYTFDDDGLEISSGDSEITTLITEDGMKIYKNTEEVLTADNQGVKATDLHARTYLIIGENSRLEDKGNRTACFWIGPAGG